MQRERFEKNIIWSWIENEERGDCAVSSWQCLVSRLIKWEVALCSEHCKPSEGSQTCAASWMGVGRGSWAQGGLTSDFWLCCCWLQRQAIGYMTLGGEQDRESTLVRLHTCVSRNQRETHPSKQEQIWNSIHYLIHHNSTLTQLKCLRIYGIGEIQTLESRLRF